MIELNHEISGSHHSTTSMTHGFESIRRRFFFGPVALLEEIDGQQNMMDGLRFRKWMAERLQSSHIKVDFWGAGTWGLFQGSLGIFLDFIKF